MHFFGNIGRREINNDSLFVTTSVWFVIQDDVCQNLNSSFGMTQEQQRKEILTHDASGTAKRSESVAMWKIDSDK